jgi:hypothetical protein
MGNVDTYRACFASGKYLQRTYEEELNSNITVQLSTHYDYWYAREIQAGDEKNESSDDGSPN